MCMSILERRRSEEDGKFCGVGVTGSVSHLMWLLGSKLWYFGREIRLSNGDPSLQSLIKHLDISKPTKSCSLKRALPCIPYSSDCLASHVFFFFLPVLIFDPRRKSTRSLGNQVTKGRRPALCRANKGCLCVCFGLKSYWGSYTNL